MKGLALLAGITYETAHAALAAQGRKNGKGSSPGQIAEAAKALGMPLAYITMPTDRILAKYPPYFAQVQHVLFNHVTKFRSIWASAPDMLIYSQSHVGAVIGGTLHDWANQKAKRVVMIQVRESDLEAAKAWFNIPA